MLEVTVDDLAAARADGVLLVDVREPAEYVAGHVPGAVLMPMGDVPARWHELPTDAPVYLICRSGHRSGHVAEALAAQGLDARNVTGGTLAWVRTGRDVVTGLEPGD